MNLQSELKNSLSQYGRSKMADRRLWVKVLKILKTRFLPEIDFMGEFFGPLIINPQSELKNSLSQYSGSKMADPRLRIKVLKMLKTRFLPEIDYSGVFRATDYESAVRIENFLIAIWRTNILEGKIDPKE